MAAKSNMKLDLEGAEALLKALEALDARAIQRVLGNAANYAATPVLQAARKLAPKRSGITRKSLGRKRVRHRKGGGVSVIIGPRTGVTGVVDGKPHEPAKIAHLVEGGHINRDGSYTPPHPFLRPALEAMEGHAMARMREKTAEGIKKEAAKAARKKK